MRKKTTRHNYFIDFLTSLFLTMAVVIGVYCVHLYQQPLSILNPYPPIEGPMELPVDEISFAVTKTIQNIPTRTPTITTSPTSQPTRTQESKPDATATMTPTVELTPSSTPDPQIVRFTYITPATNVDEIFYTPTPHSIADYIFEFAMLHEAEPQASPWNDFVANPILNCNWFGVGGQVFDYHGNPILGAQVKLGGTFPDTNQFVELYTSTSFGHNLGDGGYDFKLSDIPFTAVNSFWVQVIDEAGIAISAKAHFSISPHCTVNLIRIDFIQVQ